MQIWSCLVTLRAKRNDNCSPKTDYKETDMSFP